MTITLQDLMSRAAALTTNSTDDEVNQLMDDLDEALKQSPVLATCRRTPGRDDSYLEGDNGPLLQVVYEIQFGQKYSTELAFTLRDRVFACYVRTWFFPQGYATNTNNFELAMNGELDHDAVGATFDEVIQKAIDHRVSLAENLGIRISESARLGLFNSPLDALEV